MTVNASLVVERPGGEQIVRRPRPTDAVGEALRAVHACGTALPADMLKLLREIDRGVRH